MIKLNRALNLYEVILFGLGTILGAGVYTLIGKIVGIAGIFSPLAFLFSAIIALFTGLSYAELSSRIPKASGEVNYVYNAFSSKVLATLVGILVVFTGIISAAAVCNGLHGYLTVFFGEFNKAYSVIGLMLFFAIISSIGVKASVGLIAGITILEILGILLVVFISFGNEYTFQMSLGAVNEDTIGTIVVASFITFYAFIGFEDMVNLAEETKSARKTLPKALIIVLLISALLYVLASIAVLMALPIEKLEVSQAPFADIMHMAGYSPHIITLISLVAIANGALVQLIMVSRVLYGMSKQKLLPAFFANLHAKYRTPVLTIWLVAICIVILGCLGELKSLAIATSFVILIVFAFVNVALIRFKSYARKDEKYSGFTTHYLVPYCGATICIFMLLYSILY